MVSISPVVFLFCFLNRGPIWRKLEYMFRLLRRGSPAFGSRGKMGDGEKATGPGPLCDFLLLSLFLLVLATSCARLLWFE